MPDDGQQPASPLLLIAAVVGYVLMVVVVAGLVVLGFRAFL
jgi:hypothetical protein